MYSLGSQCIVFHPKVEIRGNSFAETIRDDGSQNPCPPQALPCPGEPNLSKGWSQDRQPDFQEMDENCGALPAVKQRMLTDQTKEAPEAKEAADHTKEAPEKEAADHTKEAPGAEAPEHAKEAHVKEAPDHLKEALDHAAGSGDEDLIHINGLCALRDMHSDDEPATATSPITDISDVPQLEDKQAPVPPRNAPSLSPSAIDKRIRRTFTKRVDGSLKVPERFYQDWLKKGEARMSLLRIFASCGYCPVSH